jgi:putative transposase
MWTLPLARSIAALRYQSDVTDQEWLVIDPLFPKPKIRGRRPLREIVNAIFYVMRSGCAWRLLPADFPPWSTVYLYGRLSRCKSNFDLICLASCKHLSGITQ